MTHILVLKVIDRVGHVPKSYYNRPIGYQAFELKYKKPERERFVGILLALWNTTCTCLDFFYVVSK